MSETKTRYRELLRRHLSKAQTFLASDADDDVIYACLELRKSLEAYAYMHLSDYLPQASFRLARRTWQADKVIKELMQIDPGVSSSGNVYFTADGGTDKRKLGEDRRLPVDILKKYHALGNFLHLPMVRTAASDTDFGAAKATAQEIEAILSKLYAPGWINVHLNPPTYQFSCSTCEWTVVRRKDRVETGTVIECGNCGHRWEAQITDGKLEIVHTLHGWQCKHCGADQTLEDSKLIHGRTVTCEKCRRSGTVAIVHTWTIRYPDDMAEDAC